MEESKSQFKKRQVPMKELHGGVMKPQLGFGTWLFDEKDIGGVLKKAIRDYGYRQIDTAKMYGNEAAIGKCIKECINEGICKREDLFITTKLWIDGRGRVEQELRESCQRLGVDYVDLYVMHFMVPYINPKTLEVGRDSLLDVWRELEKCQLKGLTRAIGVSNCNTVMLMEILSFCEIKPACNQLEIHPYLTQDSVHEFHKRMDIPLEAYAPLNPQQDPYANPKCKGLEVLKDKVLLDLAQKYNKSAEQIVLNWHIRMGHFIFPRMSSEEHLRQNMEIFDFELNNEDYNKISSLNKDARFYDRIPTAEFSFIPIAV